MRTTSLSEPHGGALAHDGFAAPVLLKLHRAPKQPVSLHDQLLIARHFQATPMEGRLAVAIDLPAEELARATAVELGVWMLALTPMDEVQVAVGGRILSLQADEGAGRNDELTSAEIDRLLRERGPVPRSHPLVLTVPPAFFRPGRNQLVASFHRPLRATEMCYAVPLELRWRLVPGP